MLFSGTVQSLRRNKVQFSMSHFPGSTRRRRFHIESPCRAVALSKMPAIRLLSVEEESELVAGLCHDRQSIRTILRPLLHRAAAELRHAYFDQQLSYIRSMAMRTVPRTIQQRLKRPLDHYHQLKHVLVIANLPWVNRLVCSQPTGRTVTAEDFFQEGVCGLLKAIDRFEADRGLRLMTYATWYIREAMQQVRARQSNLVTLSTHDQALLRRIESQRVRFLHHHRRMPFSNELPLEVYVANRAIGRLQAAARPTISLDHGGIDAALHFAADDPIDEVDRRDETRAHVSRLLQVLPARERLVITRRFGLDGEAPASLEVLGCCLHVSKERIRQLQRQAIRRMQDCTPTDYAPKAPAS